MADEMKKNGILFILIQIDEAHSSAWPIALPNQPEPQANFGERVERANAFVQADKPPFPVYVDPWNNEFAETYRAWPDQYCCAQLPSKKIIAKSEYGTEGDENALIVMDCTVLIRKLIAEANSPKKTFLQKVKARFGF